MHSVFARPCLTSDLSLQLFYRNGHPFPVSGTMSLRVHISHTELSLEVPVTLEVLQDPLRNVLKAAFTVRKSGRYQITISVGGLNVGHSPYYKVFHPGKRQDESIVMLS